MTQTPPTSTSPTFGEMLEDTINLGVGLGVGLLPLLLLAVPGIALFVVLPAIVLLAVAVPLAAIGAVITLPPYLLARWLSARRARSSARGGSHRSPAGESSTRFATFSA